MNKTVYFSSSTSNLGKDFVDHRLLPESELLNMAQVLRDSVLLPWLKVRQVATLVPKIG